ncbi:MAG: DUF2157 domain-containing protein [Proteobacteria bacterium]|nr:DUF2157 domain-containing protein [Pseudomonadota bacterium]
MAVVIAEHFTRRWQAAGLIDGDLAARIVAWEAAHRRPVFLWAVAGMGALALSLGIMAIVGANWEDIPAWLKLAVDLGLNVACAVAVFVCWRRNWPWRRELAALLLFALVLSGIALIGQVYQLQSAPWRALVLWLAITTPFLALTSYSRLTGVIWVIAAVTTWFVAEEALRDVFAYLSGTAWIFSHHLALMGYLAACAMIVIAILRGLWPPAREQAGPMERLAWAGLIAASTVTVSIGWIDSREGPLLGPILLAALATLPAGLAVWLGDERTERAPLLALLIGSLVIWSLGLAVAPMGGKSGDLVRALLFIVYWIGIGAAAARASRRGLFGLAFTMVGLRLLILYFEAIGGLTATGLGLIGGGVLCLLLAAIGWRLTRGVASRTGGAAP